MKRFVNFSTQVKLMYGFGLMWILLAVVIVFAYRGMAGITQSEQLLHSFYFTEALELLDLRSHQNFNRAEILEMILTTNRIKQEAIEKYIKERNRQIDEILDKLFKLETNPQSQSRLKELKDIVVVYRQTREQEIALIYRGRVEEAHQLGVGIQSERFEKIHSIVKELVNKSIVDINQRLAQDMQNANFSLVLFLVIGGVGLLAGIFIIIILNKTIVNPLNTLSGVATQITGRDDLNISIPVDERKDEVGKLAQAIRTMLDNLRTSTADISESKRLNEELTASSDQLEKRTAELTHTLQRVKEAVNVIASSSSEILSATTQVASGTAETATAISETTTTVEEVRQAAQLSSEKAKIVSEKAQRVVQVSKNGRKAVEETAVVVMGQIRGQMESIALTIVRLSDQTQSIGGIIASVTDIADQSNLLAVNAGIEAARAGEQGKGFAVVAQEIKILAEQSKQATAQVRGILSDIQKATSSAVMATEQGSRVVEVGVKQAAMADEAIRVLAETSDETAQSATQIVASSQQQVVGMDQIGIAMKNINQAGAETAASMKQAETAAQNLHELGQKLKEIVEQFKG
jgi:methyl-accepting chemotaxis protein